VSKKITKENLKELCKKGFSDAEASLFLSNKNREGSQFFGSVKRKVIDGELSFDQARFKVLKYHIQAQK